MRAAQTIKAGGNGVLGKLGLRLVRRPDEATVAAASASRYGRVPHVVYRPWVDVDEEIAARTTLTAARLWTLVSIARQQRAVPGAVAEAGVYRGGTALLLSRLFADRPLFLFDSFEGLPDPQAVDGEAWSAGHFADTSEAAVRRLVADHPDVRVHKGWIPASLPADEQGPFALVHLDLDLHDPTRDCLEHFVPRLSPGGVVVVDDYGFPSCIGVREAVDAFMAGPHGADVLGIYTPTAQYLMVRRPAS